MIWTVWINFLKTAYGQKQVQRFFASAFCLNEVKTNKTAHSMDSYKVIQYKVGIYTIKRKRMEYIMYIKANNMNQAVYK